ncbi:Di-copper centre-containing protein [Linderina pennispora]|uniref:Di-copper centre-containing protein n=1 Tax=Linderina pennispora TaxID=61395 RepID=A0A1Y1VY47_9FUNG|nr:Di-copper centre-containing protein [Linderina pennispora]ORX66198.1 Di-copper centre-containing protein [Linderina pennispora]
MRDYRVPASSQVLTSAWVGGNGQSNNCVTNGVQANWQMTYPSAHCLRRQFGNNGNPTSWYSPEYIQSFIQRDTTMAQFRPDLEYSLHGVVHINIGGDMYQTYSPNDVIFWLHHANLDRIWWQWQNVASSNGALNNMWRMDGPNFDNSAISLSSNVVAYNEPINTVMQLGYGKMCFQYTNAPGPASAMSRRSGSTDLVNSVASGITNLISNVASTLNSDKALLEKWFPKTAEEVANHYIVPVATLWAGNKKEIPYPATLTPEWIAMHKFKQADVQRVENDARQFVNDMKKAGYKSPY